MDSDSVLDLYGDSLVDQPPEAEKSLPAQPQKHLSVWEVLSGMGIYPRRTFERMREDQRSHWGMVVVLLVLVSLLSAYASASTRTIAFNGGVGGIPPGATVQGQNGNPQFTPPQGQTGAANPGGTNFQAARGGFGMLQTALGFVGSTVGMLLNYLVASVLILGLSLIFGGKTSFKQIFPVAVWSSLPLLLRIAAQAVAALVKGVPSVAGLSGMLTAAEAASMPLLNTLLSNIDIYLVWSLVLLGVGISVMTGLNRNKSTLIVLAFVLISGALLIGLTLAGQSLQQLVGLPQFGPGGGRRFGGG